MLRSAYAAQVIIRAISDVINDGDSDSIPAVVSHSDSGGQRKR